MAATPRRWLWVSAVLGLLALVNLPVLHSAWTRAQVQDHGVDVTAEVTRVREVPGGGDEPTHLVAYRLPGTVGEGDGDGDREYAAEVDPQTYERADRTGDLVVRVLPGSSAHVVPGAVHSRLSLVVVLAADAVLLGMGGLAWWYLRRGPPSREPGPLRLVALGDVQRCKPGARVLERDGEYEVVGEVTAISDDEVVLQAGGRTVVVTLDGYALQVGYQQPAWVWARAA